MRWAQLETDQPRLAEIGRRRLLDPGVVLVATIRRDGTPRISPVEPLVLDGELWLTLMWHSTKATDLVRDPRILLHSVITSRDGGAGEYKVRGSARPETDEAVQRRHADAVAEQLGWRPAPGRFHLFAVDFEQVSYLRYVDETGDQFVAMWPPAREFVRRGTSATSLGVREPHRNVLA
jgi:Pyridoxamine 5''-phosphate oxidase.